MLNDNDEIIMPDTFLPVAHEFGLSARIDSWVLEHTLIFMDKRRKASWNASGDKYLAVFSE
jgi:EAL domain-containing protein (putative c-di-GMP-specific phosphodiesterase class I)